VPFPITLSDLVKCPVTRSIAPSATADFLVITGCIDNTVIVYKLPIYDRILNISFFPMF